MGAGAAAHEGALPCGRPQPGLGAQARSGGAEDGGDVPRGRETIPGRGEAAAGREAWTRDRIQMVLRNEAYRGDILTNKTVVLDYLTKKSVRNQGQVEQYYLEQHHDPIVAPEIFDTVQDYLKQGLLNGRNKQLRAAWMQEHPEVLMRRNRREEMA